MDNKTKIDRLHELLPKYLNTRNNVNWNGLIDAVGQEDENLAQLVAEVRKQFFVKTASRPYIDVLAANQNISRPKLVGMSDASFSQYIPVLSYKPKQVKLIIDALLDIFFFKESTTAFIMSGGFQPFALQNGWELQLQVDGVFQESIVFNTADFTNITAALADEIVASYNRQSKYSYATNYYDSITKHSYIRIFTNTVGAKGSLQITGGRANIALQLNGFLSNAGTGSNTQWTVSKIGDTTTFTHTGGASPNVATLQAGDILISNLPGNQGSFPITTVDVSNDAIVFNNLFSTVGSFTQLSSNDTKFIRPDKYVVYKTPRRAVAWETSSGEVTVEMPTTPPVVQRSLKGSMHINGVVGLMANRNSNTSLTLANANGFPAAGSFVIEPVDAITSRILTPDINQVITTTSNGRLIYDVQKYSYTSRIVLSTTGSVTAGSDQITVASTVGLVDGMNIFMAGFREDAVITDITGLVVTSSIPATQTLVAAAVDFGGNTLTGITPNLPTLSALNEVTLTSLTRTSGVITAVAANNYNAGDNVFIVDSSGINFLVTTGDTNSSKLLTNVASITGVSPGQLLIGAGIPSGTRVDSVPSPTSILMTKAATATAVGVTLNVNEDTNGTFNIASASPTQFTFNLLGGNGSALVAGTASTEGMALSNVNSRIILTNSQSSDNTRINGSYVWDTKAPYVLSSALAPIQDQIVAGKIIRLLNVGPNSIPNETGYVIFDYGLNTQEGPIKYLYKPADNILALDPSYIFQKNHQIGSSVIVVSHKGPHVMDGLAGEYGLYITDPSQARVILETLIQSVTSAGIFVNFLVRFPEQLYGTLDVYRSSTGGI
jgi:hypothetical protein